MTIESEIPEDADPADVAEQLQDLSPPRDDDEAPDLQRGEVPLEANEADVAEQWIDVPGATEDELPTPEP